eukprot:10773143-Lingulodinium_polyedra.AAC.1
MVLIGLKTVPGEDRGRYPASSNGATGNGSPSPVARMPRRTPQTGSSLQACRIKPESCLPQVLR